MVSFLGFLANLIVQRAVKGETYQSFNAEIIFDFHENLNNSTFPQFKLFIYGDV